MDSELKKDQYQQIAKRIDLLIQGEKDPVAVLSTVVCELHQNIDYYHWTGFYRVTQPELLSVGPYQGGHGCLRIAFNQGICGRAARSGSTVIIDDVHQQSDHIACSTSTISEIVVPWLNRENELLGVLDVDSDFPAAFDAVDQHYLEKICAMISHVLDG